MKRSLRTSSRGKSKLLVALLTGISLAMAIVASAAVRRPQEQQKPATAAAPAAAPNAPAPLKKPRRPPPPPDETVERGHTQFTASCAFCHGADATGARAPDLLRSPIVAHDVKGNLIGDVVHNGRPDKGMPPLPLSDEQIADIAAYLHWRIAQGLSSSEVPQGYPAEKLLTGNAQAGKAFFEGEGGCTKCHSATGDLANVSGKYSAIDLEAQMLYPEGKFKSAKVTLKSGEVVEGKLEHLDEFSVAVTDANGWYHAYSRDEVKVEVTDKLAAHRAMLDKITQKQMHDLFAYVHTLEKEGQQ
jgi:cytochrome c oxidase cbb3-type subunit III